MIGKTLGRYRLEASLGRGGMAEVFRAHDERLGRTVAVKVVLPAFASEPQFGERFLREARLVAGLEHPHILPVYDSGESDGVPYLVMPYLQGGTLVERLGAGPLPPATALRWIGELAEALDAAHLRGVLHRDVKPANVLLGTGDRALLADFGIAKSAGGGTQLTATGVVIGTPTYMAPELAKGQPASRSSDLYALAVLAYEMLTGAPPFRGESALSLLHQHVSTPPPNPSAGGTLPTEIDLVFVRALAKEPEQRFASCADFAQALRDALASVCGDGASTVADARTVNLPTAERRPDDLAIVAPKRRVSWLGIAIGATVLLIAAMGLWRLLGTPPQPEVEQPAASVEPAPPISPSPEQPPAPASAVPPSAEAPPQSPAPQPATPETAAAASVSDGVADEADAADEPEAATADSDQRSGGRRAETADEVRRYSQETEARSRTTSRRESLKWLHDRFLAEGVTEPRATFQTATVARRLWGAAAANQVWQQACAAGVQEACAELRKRAAQRPRQQP